MAVLKKAIIYIILLLLLKKYIKGILIDLYSSNQRHVAKKIHIYVFRWQKTKNLNMAMKSENTAIYKK